MSPEVCNEQPQQPTNVGASASSYDSITVYWQKPFGSGFRYNVTVRYAGNIKDTKVGEMDNSTAGSVTINGLQPRTGYTVEVYLACESTPEKLSSPAVSTTVNTLPGGLYFVSYLIKTIIYQEIKSILFLKILWQQLLAQQALNSHQPLTRWLMELKLRSVS